MITSSKKGFTLLELLIVIAIIAILSVVLIVALNPAETLRKTRDSQRISDLASLKTALGIYVTTITTPDLDGGGAGNANCLDGTPVLTAKVWYSTDAGACAANIVEGGDVSAGSTFLAAGDFCLSSATPTLTDGTGWVPVDLGAIPGGAPISNLPVDPTNTVAVANTPASTDLVYRYACQAGTDDGKPATVFEVNAQLESNAFTVTDDRRTKDGGDNTNLYEVGTTLRLLGGGVNF